MMLMISISVMWFHSLVYFQALLFFSSHFRVKINSSFHTLHGHRGDSCNRLNEKFYALFFDNMQIYGICWCLLNTNISAVGSIQV